MEISLLAFMGHPWFTKCHYLTVSKLSCNCYSLSKAKNQILSVIHVQTVGSQFIKLFILCMTFCIFNSYYEACTKKRQQNVSDTVQEWYQNSAKRDKTIPKRYYNGTQKVEKRYENGTKTLLKRYKYSKKNSTKRD